jgi:hypothetical protein
MKTFKFLLPILFFFSSCVFGAKHEMRIVRTPRVHIYYNYYSHDIDDSHTLKVFLPENYSGATYRHPTIYWIGQNCTGDYPEAVTEFLESLKKDKKLSEQFKNPIVVAVNIDSSDANRDFWVKLLSLQLVPFIDLNYRTFNSPDRRLIISDNMFAAYYVTQREQSIETAYVRLSNLSADRYWKSDKIENMPRKAKVVLDFDTFDWQNLLNVYFRFMDMGFKPVRNFLLHKYDVKTMGKVFDYLYSDFKGFGGASAKGFVSSKILSHGSANVIFGADIKLKNKLKTWVFPAEVKSSPPYVNYDRGRINIISGALPTKVKISAEFEKKRFNARIRIVSDK